jgi:predicted LPLAT superfamily acyltransferase
VSFRPCAIVPSFNHYQAVADVVAGLRARNLAVFVVDDGSSEPARSALAALHDPENGVVVERLRENQGKGGAVIHGLRKASQNGYSHAVQIDADGQHDLSDLPGLIGLAEKHPNALISGKPVYDETIPLARKAGRWLTHVWVWIETLSFRISDSMCGYRVYPLGPTLAVIESEKVGRRMDFDPEIMVRLFWRGVPTIVSPVHVTYPENNTSNFHVLNDNWLITRMHTRLVCTMLSRLRSILRNRPESSGQPVHWASLEERGMDWGLRFLAFSYRLLGRRVCFWILQPVLLYFFLTGTRHRKASENYWRRLYSATQSRETPSRRRVFTHFRAFGEMALDKFSAWMGDITLDDLILPEDGEIERVTQSGKGILVIVSHLGNIEVSRALSKQMDAVKITVFAHTEHAVKFNRLLSSYNPEAAIDVVQVSEMGPSTAIDLEARIDRGEWVVIAGDRIPVTGQKRLSDIKFLGDTAPFSQGSIILASLLKCPVYMMLCVKEGQKYRVLFQKLANKVELPRRSREEAIDLYLQNYVSWLEMNCKSYPDQWFNFFEFWDRGV